MLKEFDVYICRDGQVPANVHGCEYSDLGDIYALEAKYGYPKVEAHTACYHRTNEDTLYTVKEWKNQYLRKHIIEFDKLEFPNITFETSPVRATITIRTGADLLREEPIPGRSLRQRIIDFFK